MVIVTGSRRRGDRVAVATCSGGCGSEVWAAAADVADVAADLASDPAEVCGVCGGAWAPIQGETHTD